MKKNLRDMANIYPDIKSSSNHSLLLGCRALSRCQTDFIPKPTPRLEETTKTRHLFFDSSHNSILYHNSALPLKLDRLLSYIEAKQSKL